MTHGPQCSAHEDGFPCIHEEAARQAVANAAIEGLTVSAETQKLLAPLSAGEISIEDVIRNIEARHGVSARDQRRAAGGEAMSDTPRWRVEGEELWPDDGSVPEFPQDQIVVTYADHLAALRACEQQGQRDAIADAMRVVAGFLDIDTDTGDRRCSDPTCDLCVVAPLIYAALEDVSKGDHR